MTEDTEFCLDLTLKKKKKKPVITEPVIEDQDRDYAYTDLLRCIYSQLQEKNPTISQTVKSFVIPPPQLIRVGTRKTMWSNFAQIAQAIRRQPDSIMQFMLTELGTEGSIDGNSRLLIKGKYSVKVFESLLRKYISEYVTCHTCRKQNTLLIRDPITRLYFVQCEDCQSRQCVAPIKTGFHATLKGDRKKLKAQE